MVKVRLKRISRGKGHRGRPPSSTGIDGDGFTGYAYLPKVGKGFHVYEGEAGSFAAPGVALSTSRVVAIGEHSDEILFRTQSGSKYRMEILESVQELDPVQTSLDRRG
jgi:hypothetical protein